MKINTHDPLILMIIFLSVIVFFFCLVYGIVTNFQDAEPEYYEPYGVQANDTLWDIAKKSDGYGTIDTRKIIDRIKEVSDVSSMIYPDQLVYIPMYEKE